MQRKSIFTAIIILGLILVAGNSMNQAAEFSVNPNRLDPYKQFKFRVKWDGQYIPGILRISGLHRETEVVVMRKGSESNVVHKLPGRTDYQPITLERGLTHDTAFEQWANKVWNLGASPGNEVSLKDFRKDMVIELLNEAGQMVMAFHVYRCWPVKYNAVEALDANNPNIAIESIVLEHEGWVRDYAVTEPVEPSFSTP